MCKDSYAAIVQFLEVTEIAMASGTVNGSNNSPESVSYAHNMDHDLDYLDMVNTLETTSLNSQKASTMVLLFINDYFKEY